MILPFDRIEARLAEHCPGLPDVEARVRARLNLYANDWPLHQLAVGLYEQELRRAGCSYPASVRAGIQVHIALGVF